jgi:hypothetical protein
MQAPAYSYAAALALWQTAKCTCSAAQRSPGRASTEGHGSSGAEALAIISAFVLQAKLTTVALMSSIGRTCSYAVLQYSST